MYSLEQIILIKKYRRIYLLNMIKQYLKKIYDKIEAVNKINAASAEEYFCVRIVIPDC